MSLSIAEAADLLGMPEHEVIDIEDSPAGDVITTFDGTRLLNCVEPDAEGKTGLMFLVAPTKTYGGAFPVYAQPGAVDGDESPNRGPATIAEVLDAVGDDTERAQAALDLERASDKPRVTLVSKLEEIIAAAGAGGQE